MPRFCLSQRVANLVNGILRGSITINFTLPNSTPFFIHEEITGWASVIFEPVTKISSDFSISAIGFVMAPDPKAAASPATVEAWQSLAQ
ncbi:hypothetical protein ES703_122105 [subsurface metagenome]